MRNPIDTVTRANIIDRANMAPRGLTATLTDDSLRVRIALADAYIPRLRLTGILTDSIS